MSAIRLRRLTAIYLAAMYGAVGIFGESIHYLTTEGWSFWTASADIDSGGYYHFHAPDYHGHYHRHAHHGGHSHTHGDSHAKVVNKADETSKLGVEITALGGTHRQHACPALALVSTLKLSYVGGCVASLTFDSVNSPALEARCIPAFEVALCLCPRGPPIVSVA